MSITELEIRIRGERAGPESTENVHGILSEQVLVEMCLTLEMLELH